MMFIYPVKVVTQFPVEIPTGVAAPDIATYLTRGVT